MITMRSTQATRCIFLAAASVVTASAHGSVVVTWIGPTTGNWSQTSGWTGLPSGYGWPNNDAMNTFDVIVDGNAAATALTVNVNPAIVNLTVNAGDTLTISGGKQLQVGADPVAGTLANDGAINVDSSGTSSILWGGSGNTTISGSGEVVLSGTPASKIRTWSNNNWIKNGPLHTIRGAGQIGQPGGFTNIINEGLVQADGPTPLYLYMRPGTNTGIIEAANGATLVLWFADFVNTGGLISASARSTVEVFDADVSGGQVGAPAAQGGGGLIHIPGGRTGAFYTVTFGDDLFVDDGATMILGPSTLTNNATIHVDGQSALTRIQSVHATLVGTGQMVLSDSSNSRIWGTDFTNGPSHTIRGGGQLGVDSIELKNFGLIEATAAGGMVLDLVDDLTGQPFAAGNGNYPGGVLRATAGSTLTITDCSMINDDARVEADPAAFVEFTGSTGIRGGVIEAIDDRLAPGRVVNLGTCELDSVTVHGVFDNQDGATLTLRNTHPSIKPKFTGELLLNSTASSTSPANCLIKGDVTIDGGGDVILSDSLGNAIGPFDAALPVEILTLAAGTTIRGSGRLGLDGLSLMNRGTIQTDGTQGLSIDVSAMGSFTNESTGLLHVFKGALRLLDGPFTNKGTVTIDSTRLLDRTGTYTQTNGATHVYGVPNTSQKGRLKVNGGSATFSSGVLDGSGRVSGSVIASGAGGVFAQVKPGQPVGGATVWAGDLEIEGTYTQTGTARLVSHVQLGVPPFPPKSSKLRVKGAPGGGGGTASINGTTLELVFVGGAVPQPGKSVVVLTATGGVIGTFANVIVPGNAR
jgi:hypothetical protein